MAPTFDIALQSGHPSRYASSLLDIQLDQPEDHMMATNSDNTAIEDLTRTVKVIESNYATKEDIAVLNGKTDALTTRIDGMSAQFELAMKLAMDEAFQRHTEMMYKVFATKEELANTICQQTWRMAAFGGLLLSAGFAFARYL